MQPGSGVEPRPLIFGASKPRSEIEKKPGESEIGSGMVFPLQKRECWVPYKPQKNMKIVEIEGSYTRNIVGTSPLCRN